MAHRVTICGVDTSTLPKLKAIDAKELMQRLKAGDGEAREQFIRGNIRLVLSIVQRFKETGNSDDLFQVGCVGLLKAIDNFDISVGVMFSTYAVPMIIGEIRRFLRDSSSIKVARHLRDVAYRALDTREKLIRDGKEGTVMEVSDELMIPEREVVEALDAVSEPISLEARVWGDGEDTLLLMEQIADKSTSEEIWTENFTLIDGMSKLTDRERKIITLRYYDGKTQTEISTSMNISQAQVSRLEKSAISKLREYKKLLDEGVISKEEFDNKKKELL